MLIVVLLAGLVVGSFINAAVWRVRQRAGGKPGNEPRPANLSLLRGRSVCPNCKHQLAAKDLVPVISWLALKGKCRYCKKPISWQYPLVELLSASLFVWSFIVLGPVSARDYAGLVFWLVILAGLIFLGVYDWLYKELPNQAMWLLISLSLLQLGAFAVWDQSLRLLGTNLLAGLAVGLFFYALFAVSNGRWMGGGDVKLAFLMGVLLGGRRVLVAMFIGFNSAALYSLLLMAAKKVSRKDTIPFGPFLIAGAIIGMLYGDDLINAYIDFFAVF